MEGTESKLVLLGFGRVAEAIGSAAVAAGWTVSATTRSSSRKQELRQAGVEPIVMESLDGPQVAELVRDAFVLVSFQPGQAAETDSYISPFCSGARQIIYISSTAVYDAGIVDIDDSTPLGQAGNFGNGARQRAEQLWRAQRALVLRLSSFYGDGVGLHVELTTGKLCIPGDGSGYLSMISLSDLARIVLACFENGIADDAYVVADLQPVTKLEIYTWLCNRLQIAMPPTLPLEEVPFFLRPSRRVDGSGILRRLEMQLQYPTYRDGYEHLLPPAVA